VLSQDQATLRRRYFLSTSKSGDTAILAFSSPAPLSVAALQAVYDEYQAVATPGHTEGFQISLQVGPQPAVENKEYTHTLRLEAQR